MSWRMRKAAQCTSALMMYLYPLTWSAKLIFGLVSCHIILFHGVFDQKINTFGVPTVYRLIMQNASQDGCVPMTRFPACATPKNRCVSFSPVQVGESIHATM